MGLRRKIRGALAYPAFLLFASFCMVLFLTIYVVPKMNDLFSGFGNELPLPTTIVVGISHWLSETSFGLEPLAAALVVAIFPGRARPRDGKSWMLSS